MMLRVWFKVFILHLSILVLSLIALLMLLVYGLHFFTFEMLLHASIYQFPLWSVILAFVSVLSAMSAFLMSRGICEPYEQIEAKLNWLLLGKYRHASFDQISTTPNWYEPNQVIDETMAKLRDKMVQLSDDLQEFSAAPIFVGSQTKEEIIEQERQRIARELHDSVSQQLFASMMMLSAINETSAKDLPPITQKQLAKIEEIINNAQTEMRALLLHLRPIELADKSLKEGITQLLQELKPKIPQDVRWELESIKMESGIEDHLFRIVQEAISNTLRHAKATNFEVFLTEQDDMVHLKIVDNGRGFDTSANQKVGSYGLINMKERIKSLGGTIRVVSLVNQGTSIDITVPLKRK